jgi:hypothetical protein
MTKLVGKIYRERDNKMARGDFILVLNHPLGGEKIIAKLQHNEFLKIVDDHWVNR